MSQENLRRLRVWLTEQGLDAYLVTQPQNRSYLSGWLNNDTEGAGILLVSQERQILLTNSLYLEAATREAAGWDIMVPPEHEYTPALVRLASEIGVARLGFEASVLSYAEYALFSAVF